MKWQFNPSPSCARLSCKVTRWSYLCNVRDTKNHNYTIFHKLNWNSLSHPKSNTRDENKMKNNAQIRPNAWHPWNSWYIWIKIRKSQKEEWSRKHKEYLSRHQNANFCTSESSHNVISAMNPFKDKISPYLWIDEKANKSMPSKQFTKHVLYGTFWNRNLANIFGIAKISIIPFVSPKCYALDHNHLCQQK